MSSRLIVPIGPPGCGKSTFASELVSTGLLDPDAIVSPDHYRRVITGDRANQEGNGVVFQVCELIGRARLHRGLDVYWDATNLTPESHRQLRSMAASTKAAIIAVKFPTAWRDLVGRNANRLHPVPVDVLERMYAQYALVDVKSLVTTDCYTPTGARWAIQKGVLA